MLNQPDRKQLTTLLTEVMRIQKRYAHEQVGAKNDRRAEVKKIVNRIVGEMEKTDGN